jgi:hypothetical protein
MAWNCICENCGSWIWQERPRICESGKEQAQEINLIRQAGYNSTVAVLTGGM